MKPHATPRFRAGYRSQIVLLRDEREGEPMCITRDEIAAADVPWGGALEIFYARHTDPDSVGYHG